MELLVGPEQSSLTESGCGGGTSYPYLFRKELDETALWLSWAMQRARAQLNDLDFLENNASFLRLLGVFDFTIHEN